MTQLSVTLNWALYFLYISGNLDNQATASLLSSITSQSKCLRP